MKKLTIKEIEYHVGTLSQPSKMPCHGYSLPATECKRGSILRKVKNSVCSECYALKNRYLFDNVQNAMHKRIDSLKTDRLSWEILLGDLIDRKEKSGHFRWHDSGDLQSPEHLTSINRIAKRLPHIKFWLPTRELVIVEEWLKTNKISPNLNIRISASLVGKTISSPLTTNPNITTSTVGADQNKNSVNCPAPKQENKCKNCRACWDTSVSNINYTLH